VGVRTWGILHSAWRINYRTKKGIAEEIGPKGTLSVLITGAAVTAFAASNLYILGLSLSIHQSLASYFEILDYIQITPAWALPGLLLSSLLALCLLIYFGVAFGATSVDSSMDLSKGFYKGVSKAVARTFEDLERDFKRIVGILVWVVGPLMLLMGIQIINSSRVQTS